MSPNNNGQIALYFHFQKIIKEPGTSFQYPVLSQKYLGSNCHTALVFDQISSWYYIGVKRNNHLCNFHYVAMPVMTLQILKSADFTKTEKSRYLENKTFFLQTKKFINYPSTATLLQEVFLQNGRYHSSVQMTLQF